MASISEVPSTRSAERAVHTDPKPGRAKVKLVTMAYLYWLRLKKQPLQELFALAGIAAGVALVFAVQIASASLSGSVQTLVHGLSGKASLEVAARSESGFDQQLARRIAGLSDVAASAPLLVHQVSVIGPHGRRGVSLVGTGRSIAGLDSPALRNAATQLARPGVSLPASVAAQIGARAGQRIRLQVGAQIVSLPLASVLGKQQIGGLLDSPIAVVSLALAQRVTGLSNRVTAVEIVPKAGRERQVEAELSRSFGGTLDVRPSDSEVELLRAAAVPNNQSSTLFAVIGAVVGLLFAFNAMLLTTPARRRNLAALRLEGADRPRALQMMAFEALALGVLASGLGLLLGEELSRQLFREPPKYLTSAFPVGTQRVVPLGVAVGAFAAGVLATLLAASRPALDLFSRRPIDSIYHDAERPTEGISPRLARSMLLVGLGLIGVVVLVILTIPAIGVTGGGLLAICMLLMCPAIVVWALGFLDWLTFRLRRPRLLAIASIELRAAPTRVIALSATAAVAMFGILTIQGGQHDLLRGIAAAQRSFNRTANLWIVPGGQENAYATELFSTGPETTLITIIRHVPGVSAVRVYQSSFRDLEGRRVWVIARPSGDRPLIQSATLREGNLQLAERELRAGGWVVLSSKLAEDRSLHIGEPVRLTTPAGERSFDLAATVASLWPSGTILMNPADYRSAWESVTPTALEVDLKPGIHLAVARVAVAKALSHYGGLRVQTSAERQSEQNSVARQGPKQITEIGDLLVIVAALALGAAIAASLWERRPRFAALKIYGCDARQIWVLLTIETAAILIIGCMIGAIFGFCGQAFATLWVKHISGFPVIYRPAGPLALQTLAAITILGTAVVALPGRAVARVAPKLGFHE